MPVTEQQRPHRRQTNLSTLTSTHLPTFAALLLALTLLLPACSNTQSTLAWNQNFLVAARLQDTEQFDQAEQHYKYLREHAPDQEKQRDVDFELAKILLQRGDKQAALQAFLTLAEPRIQDNAGSKSLYEAARILAESDVPQSLLLYQKTITDYPEFIAADFALSALRTHYLEHKQYAEFLQVLDQLFPSVSHANLSNHILFARAKLLEEHFNNDNDALIAYRQLYKHCDGCALADEALWQMAHIYIHHQHWQPAIQILEQLAKNIEASWFVGTYNSPRAGDARYLLAEINLLFLDDYKTADKQFSIYISDFPNSTRTDDAAWNRVEIQRLSGSDASYQKSLERFARDYPESRYLRTIHARSH